MRVREFGSALVRRVSDRLYVKAHYAGARYAQAKSASPTHPPNGFLASLSSHPRVHALWRAGILKTLVVASTIRGAEGPPSHAGRRPVVLSTVSRLNPIPEVSRENFLARLADHTQHDQALVRLAYDLGLAAHGEQVRNSSTPYFEHPKRVALILIDECGITDARLIAAALLHDAIEDTTLFGATLEDAHATLTWLLGKDMADMIVALTKQSAVEKRLSGGLKKDRMTDILEYVAQLIESPHGTVLVKMADRLHNLRTLKSLPAARAKRILSETKTIYLPLFRQAETYYAEQPQYLAAARMMIAQMEAILADQ